jgi:lysophospholipase L1-like esterase
VFAAASNVSGCLNVAVDSQKLTDMSSDVATQVAPIGTRRAIVVCFGGTNDLALEGVSGQTAYNRMVSYAQAARAQGAKVLAVTPLPRSDAGIAAGFETERQDLSDRIVADGSNFDAKFDVRTDHRIGDAGDELDATFFQADKVHLNVTGQQALADDLVPVVNGL